MIKNLILERERTKNEVIYEISDKWGNKQTIAGPVLTLPYKVIAFNNKKTVEIIKYAHFLPEVLDISGEIIPELRYRGIYKVIAYKTKLNFEGFYKNFNLEKLKLSPDEIIWEDAFVSIGIPDMNGINDPVKIKWNNEEKQTTS